MDSSDALASFPAATRLGDKNYPLRDGQLHSESMRNAISSKEHHCPAQRIPQQRRRKRRQDSLGFVLREWVLNHQIGISINLLALLFLAHLTLPRARPYTRKFVDLAYFNPNTNFYLQGPDDFYFIATWIVIFTGVRAATMEYLLLPLANYGGVEKKKGRIRFAEQGWLFIYCTVFWTVGMYIMYNSEYWLDFRQLWAGWPKTSMTGLFKWYYLAQLAFWFQQILVVNIEERRKDHYQMFTHHIVTCCLVLGSYGNYHTRVGNLIMCLMDVVDILLALAKMLKYMHYDSICDYVFGIFMVAWMVCRHVIYLMVCWSVYKDWPVVTEFGCYSSVTGERVADVSTRSDFVANLMASILHPEKAVCSSESLTNVFLAVLLSLQVITIIWYFMIVRVAWRILKGGNADDSRSDDEEEEEDYSEDNEDIFDIKRSPTPPLEQEVGVEDMHFKGRSISSRKSRKGHASTSGVTIPGHSDKKELLGRIGCDKTT